MVLIQELFSIFNIFEKNVIRETIIINSTLISHIYKVK